MTDGTLHKCIQHAGWN